MTTIKAILAWLWRNFPLARFAGFNLYDCDKCRDSGEFEGSGCPDCCQHGDRDHDICIDCGAEIDPGIAIDRAMDSMEDR